MELCHVFMFARSDGHELLKLRELGLEESFRRDHPGQGTSNVCYCFDNAYLEILMVTDRAEIESAALKRTALSRRAQWPADDSSPFGIGLRAHGEVPFATWPYRAPFLPKSLFIPVDEDSEDPTQPFVFVSPGRLRPDQFTDGRDGARQVKSGFREITAVELQQPREPSRALQSLSSSGFPITVLPGPRHAMLLALSTTTGDTKYLSLPDIALL